VVDRILPYLVDRDLAVVSAAGGGLVTSREGRRLRIRDGRTVAALVEEGALAFFADPLAHPGEVWFSAVLSSTGSPFEVVRLTALKLRLALGDLGLDPLMYYDGTSGVRFLWTWGVPDPADLPFGFRKLNRTVAAGLRTALERRMADTPERDRIGRWLGFEGEVTVLTDRPATAGDRVAFTVDEPGQGPSVLVPWSLSPDGSHAARPVTRADLYRFAPATKGSPAASARLRRRFPLPFNFPDAALDAVAKL
jgi:hypothetical protein